MKLHIARVLPDMIDDDDREIVTVLNARSIFPTGWPSTVFITEVLNPKDPWGWTKQFDEAKAKKIDCILKRGAFGIVMERMFAKNAHKLANIIGSCFVLTTKSMGANDEIC